jgi:hypothetical protein
MNPHKLSIFFIFALCPGVRAQTPARFLEARNYGTGPASAIVTGDFNGDGRLDAATVGSDLCIYLGKGDGSFFAKQPIGITGSSMVTADFNGDGALDLAVARTTGLLILWLCGGGYRHRRWRL